MNHWFHCNRVHRNGAGSKIALFVALLVLVFQAWGQNPAQAPKPTADPYANNPEAGKLRFPLAAPADGGANFYGLVMGSQSHALLHDLCHLLAMVPGSPGLRRGESSASGDFHGQSSE